MIKSHIKTALLAGFTTILFSTSAVAQEQNKTESKSSSGSLRLSTGINYSSGDYGELTNTNVISAPVSLKYKKGNFSIRVSVPFVQVDGPGSLIETPDGSGIGGGGGQGRGRGRGGDSGGGGSGSGRSGGVEVIDDDDDNTNVRSKRRGIGDVVVAATYSLGFGSGFYLEPSAKVKIPTASTAKRLGTGELDVTTSADIVKEIGSATIYIHGRRKFAGKPTGSNIRSTWGAGAGASISTGDTVTLGADYDWQQSSLAGNQATSDLTGWASFRLNSKINLSTFASTGLNSNSASFSSGLTISIKLN
jgi:hypothetical protein